MTPPKAVVHPVYAVIGQDRLLRNEALERILRTLAPMMDDLGPTRLDGASASLADLLDEVRTPSLLGGRRVVVLDEADDFVTPRKPLTPIPDPDTVIDKDADAPVSKNRAALEKYCSAPSPGACLILLFDSLPKNTRLRKNICAGGEVVELQPPTPWALADWIVRRAKEAHGKRMGKTGAQLLKEHVGNSLGGIDVELAKLAAYVGDRPEITPKDIDAATGEHREEKVFVVLDAIATGDADGALRAWEQVWTTDRAAPGRAIGGLAWSVRRLLEFRREWERGADIGGLARRMFTDPVTLRRRFERSSVDQLREQQRDLLAADIAAKTGLSTVDVAVERFIIKHSTRVAGIRSKAG